MPGFFNKTFLQNIIDYVLILGVLVVVMYYIYTTIMENRKSSPVVKNVTLRMIYQIHLSDVN